MSSQTPSDIKNKEWRKAEELRTATLDVMIVSLMLIIEHF